ncbi:MAG: alkaline phosphatase D family protein [Bryobacterales bacterium]|nr:alkaline phosphatase D family protein [Bryobacterales bacterium]
MALTRRAFVAAAATAPAALFARRWSGSRPWIGPEYWANPLQDWRMENGAVAAQAASNRTLHLLTHQVEPNRTGSLTLSVKITPPAEAAQTYAGFRIGIRGLLDNYRHALISANQWIDAYVRADGTLVLDGHESDSTVPLAGEFSLQFHVTSDGQAELRAGAVSVRRRLTRDRLNGNVALLAGAPEAAPKGITWRFRSWSVEGTLLAHHPEQTFGPILWTQYTLSRGVLKLTALFPPMGPADAQQAQLEIRRGNRWQRAASAPIDSLSRTATFRLDKWDATKAAGYRVLYRWQNALHEWSGTIRQEPAGDTLKLGVFSCDNGYAFPLPRLTANVRVQDPDLLFFAGDQIYEGYGGFGFVREPASLAMLDYLRKFWQFGWTWRELLRDRPAIVIPDDHDVFQGNIWGQGGRKIPPGREKGFVYGGYVEPPEWVNAVQRTQCAHLPDPVDPAPVEQGITVYFTELDYGGVSFAILEDRKFKTGPESAFPQGVPGSAEALDVPGAEMLGSRQEAFLQRWASQRPAAMKVVLSQTILCKVTTHAGPALNPNRFDLDSGAWPQSGRRRALVAVRDANPLMIHGDQHLGALVRHGIDEWDDGPYAFMVPGTANGFPRAWWPEEEKPGGHYFDSFGNRMTVLGIANPERGSNLLPRNRTHPETLAHKKGSGHGIVRFHLATKTAEIETWRYDFDARQPQKGDQFPGFPQTVDLTRRK